MKRRRSLRVSVVPLALSCLIGDALPIPHPIRAVAESSASPATSPIRVTPTRGARSRALVTAPTSLRRSGAPTTAVTGRAGEQRTLDVTAYTYTGNRTASGMWPAPGQAASNLFRFGTRLRVPGIGIVRITDRVGHGSQLDIFMTSEWACRQWGRRRLTVTVLP